MVSKTVSPDCTTEKSCETYFTSLKDSLIKLLQRPETNFNKPDLGRRYDLLKSMLDGKLHIEYPTGFEGCAKEKILAQPGHSTGLDEAFNFAYECSGHDAFVALHTTYNILEDGCFSKDRGSLPLQQKLEPLRYGDNFGLRYHFFGTALFTILSWDPASFLLLSGYHLSQRKKRKYDEIKMTVDNVGRGFGTKTRQLFK